MLKLSVEDIIEKIRQQQTFEAVSDDYSFTLKIADYSHYICGAVHDGHQFRSSLWNNCLHTTYERWYEEDPCTKQMVQSHPIVIAGLDSRFEYDLNRAPESAIYTDAWGKQLWKNPLSDEEKNLSLQKHYNFYKVVQALVETIENKYGLALVYDMHSYNWKRWDREVPTWNLGTANIDNGRFGKTTQDWSGTLGEMRLPNGIKSSSDINNTFQGNGYFLKYITQNFDNTLVLATEIAKVYCDEEKYVIYPDVVHSVEAHLKEMIPTFAHSFYKEFQ
ncbi:N-formylglutamate amidohydrolase [Spongiivirga sp. MCCC 1A20706]|uniref:N-formylglutamate amidohydrolase n=1 Tax=Spongiivirga sp. MCCC 1A20706 TaxID=3160963 RepID=UPI0039773B97